MFTMSARTSGGIRAASEAYSEESAGNRWSSSRSAIAALNVPLMRATSDVRSFLGTESIDGVLCESIDRVRIVHPLTRHTSAPGGRRPSRVAFGMAAPAQKLLAALSGGEYERAEALLQELPSAAGLADEAGTPALILACAEAGGNEDDEDDEDNETEPEDPALAASRTRVVRALLAKHAAVDGVDAQGRSALLMSVLRGDEQTVRALLEATPNLLQRPSAEGMRMSALGAAAAYGSDGVRALVEAAAQRAGLAALARQESLAASCSALLDAVVEGAELRMVESAAGAGDFEVASALALLALLGIDAEREIEAGGDPLAHAVEELYARAPLVHRKAWCDAGSLSPADLGVVLSLHCMGEADGRPMLDKLAEPYVARLA